MRYIATFMVLALLILACEANTPAASPTNTPGVSETPSVNLSAAQMKYLLFEEYPDIFFCDPDFFPVGSPEREQMRAEAEFPGIRQDEEKFAAILSELDLEEKQSYSSEEQLQVYRESKRLDAISLERQPGDTFATFELRVMQGNGFAIRGTIDVRGNINEDSREPSFNTCPICLPADALIDTPSGETAISELREGHMVWSVDEAGERAAVEILRTGSSPAPIGHELVEITLDDGRALAASPGHPLADGRLFGDLQEGDFVDGEFIELVERAPYSGRTYDILPDSRTGSYWANGIMIGSTLK